MERDVTILLLRLGLVAVIYFFLFELLVVLWRDLHSPVRPVAPAQQPSAALELVEPGDTGRSMGETVALEAVTRLGRAQQNTVILADSSVSGEHALVSYRLGRWWVEDLESRNGTYINDMRVEQPTVLTTGDVLRLGVVRLRVRGSARVAARAIMPGVR